MALNVKIGLIGKFDMLKFKNMKKVREKAIQAASAEEIKGEYAINSNAAKLHPDSLELVIEKITDRGEGRAKTYVLRPSDGSPFPYFRAGQYIALKLPMGESFVTRAYSLCSSPKEALQGTAEITIHRKPDGFAADKLLESLKVGDKLTSTSPQGFFYYEGLRDCKKVVGIAGGSGITPFISMARAIKDGTEDFDLTVLVGNADRESALFDAELRQLCADCPKVKAVNVLMDGELPGSERGLITADIIKKYAPAGDEYSVFFCGPGKMHEFIEKQTETLGIPKRRFRSKLIDVTAAVWECGGYPAECKDKVFKLTAKQCGKVYNITAGANEPLLVALERNGIKAPARCRCGECGWCRSKLVSGDVFVPKENDIRRWADAAYGYIHPCSSFPLSDIVIELPGVYY